MEKSKPTIILASASPSRKLILDQIRLRYKIVPSAFEEDMTLGKEEKWSDVAIRIALEKAKDVAKSQKNALVIAADSFTFFEGAALGKPKTYEKVKENLTRYSGKSVLHHTGMAVIDTNSNRSAAYCCLDKVYFRTLSKKDIEDYVAKEDTRQYGGGLKIEGRGAVLVKKIEGDYFGIVGLSPNRLFDLFQQLGYNLFDFIK